MSVGGGRFVAERLASKFYDQINQTFGQGEQVFVMEFPSRYLKKENYLYKTDSPYAVLKRPQIVLEEEFRLVDDLFDPYKVVGGPNGRKLSVTYELALNSFVPKFPETSDFLKDQAKIRSWLKEKVTDTIGDVEFTGARMEMFHKLNSIYLEAKAKWEKEKEEEMKKKNAEDYSRWLTHIAPVKEAEIQALYDDLVVRGYYHEVKSDLGYLDVKTAAEQLEDAKARMRNSSMSSLDESETIYPVQLQPLDWAEALDTNFEPEDLTHSKETLQYKLLDKKSQLSKLDTQLQMLLTAKTGDAKEYEEKVQQAREKLDKAQTKLLFSYSDSIGTIAKMVLAKYNFKIPEDFSHIKKDITDEIKKKAGIPIDDTDVDNIINLNKDIISAQQEMENATRALNYLQMKKVEAESTDTEKNILVLQNQIKQLNDEIKYLEAIVFSPISRVEAPKKDVPDDKKENDENEENDETDDKDKLPITNINLLPTMPPAGRWTDLVISYSENETATSNSVSSTSANVNFSSFFGLVKGSSSSALSKFSSSMHTKNLVIDIGLRVTKVNINRGGWFNPEFFTFTDGMYRILQGNSKVSNGSPKLRKDKDFFEDDQLEALRTGTIMPSYPISFLVAKDITISIQLDKTNIEDAKQAFESQSAVMTNVFCFSASGGASHSSSGESHFSGIVGSKLVIKIPGPQIIGWFLEFVPEDRSTKEYTKMPSDFLPVEAKDPVEEKDQDHNLNQVQTVIEQNTKVTV
jgi:hypothetical protein